MKKIIILAAIIILACGGIANAAATSKTSVKKPAAVVKKPAAPAAPKTSALATPKKVDKGVKMKTRIYGVTGTVRSGSFILTVASRDANQKAARISYTVTTDSKTVYTNKKGASKPGDLKAGLHVAVMGTIDTAAKTIIATKVDLF